MQIDCLLLEGPPQAFDEDVIQISASPIHGYLDLGIGQRGDPGGARELRSLVRVHYLWLAVFGDGFAQCLDAEAGVQSVREPPRQHLARRPIHDRYQIQEPTPHWDVGNITAPNLVRARNRQLPQQVWINAMLRMLFAGVWTLVDRLQAHDAHQTPHTVAARMEPVSRQVGRNLATSKERVFREHPIDLIHQFQRLSIHTNRHVIQRRPANLQQFALAGQTEVRSRLIICLRSVGLIASALVTKNRFRPPASRS